MKNEKYNYVYVNYFYPEIILITQTSFITRETYKKKE